MVLCCDTCCVVIHAVSVRIVRTLLRSWRRPELVTRLCVLPTAQVSVRTHMLLMHMHTHVCAYTHTHTQVYMYTCIGIVRMRRYTCMSSSTTENVLFKLPCHELSLLGGFYLVTGGTDHVIRIYKMYPTPNPEPWEMLGHTVSVTIKCVIVFNIHFASTHQ